LHKIGGKFWEMNMSLEFDKYQRLGAYHWDSLKLKSISDLRTFSLALWTRYSVVLEYIKPSTIGVEIGCGDGQLTYLIAKKGVRSIIGCDNNQFGIKLAIDKTSHKKNTNLQFIPKIFSECGFQESSLDFVVMADVIEHLEQPDVVLSEIFNKLKLGGKLIVTTPYKKENGKWDIYHTTEYTSETLSLVLSSHFKYVKTETFMPLTFYKLYNHFRLIRIMMNALSVFKFNLFSLRGKKNVMLISVAQKL
jgi:2-polyprenyl-3-methyl-5-hydroxy-6-metoxy-1,4-benzoquinol methylase